MGAIAVITALALGAGLASAPAHAAVVSPSASSASPAARMREAVAYVRAHDKALARAPKQKIEALILGLAKSTDTVSPGPALRRAVRGPAILGVTRSGHTLWFNKGVVAVWSAASIALIIASLIYWGVALEVAYEFAHLLFDTLVAATFGRRCAWFTYASPVSLGTYSC